MHSSSDSLSGLIKWLGREEWRTSFEEVLNQHLGPACETAGVRLDELAEILGAHEFMMLWACAFEDFLTRDCEPEGRNIVDDYLKRRGWKEPVANRRYMAALRASAMSLYEVSDIIAGRSFLARDLVRGGEPIRISERTATKSLATWDRIGARIVELNGKSIIAGGLLPFTHEASEEVVRVLAAAKKRMRRELKKFAKELEALSTTDSDEKAINAIVLARSAPLITNIWLENVLSTVLNPSLPTMVNSDGDEILFCEARYPLAPAASREVVHSCLRNVPDLRDASETVWNWVESNSTSPDRRGARTAPKSAVEARHSYQVTLENGATVLGMVELAENAVVLTTNSSARAERGKALLASALGELVRTPLTKIETVEQVMASRQPHAVDLSNEIPPDVQAEVVHVTLDKHYRLILDQPVSMLGDVTPRAATKTKKGREKLVAWLKFLENQTSRHRDAGDPMGSYDFGWMWAELGVADLRR